MKMLASLGKEVKYVHFMDREPWKHFMSPQVQVVDLDPADFLPEVDQLMLIITSKA